ncbi:MAG TPA: SseB family protein [Planctomycetota bacterium]|nr:SseB family protein [Planctomycetota bacterium]
MPLERKQERGQSGHFVPANPLEELLIQAFQHPEARPVFCRRMLQSGLLVLGSPTETGVSLRQWTVGGRKVIPVFTSRNRLEDFAGPDGACLAMQGRSVFRAMPPGVSAYLNPRSPIGREFTPEEVAALLANVPEEPEPEPEPEQEGAAPDAQQG